MPLDATKNPSTSTFFRKKTNTSGAKIVRPCPASAKSDTHMEVVLLWLDDIDDLVFVVSFAWERIRQLCLATGLLAALTLLGCELAATADLSDAASAWTPRLAVVAVASVGVWAASLLLTIADRLEAASV